MRMRNKPILIASLLLLVTGAQSAAFATLSDPNLITWSTKQHVILIGPNTSNPGTSSSSRASTAFDGRLCSVFDDYICSKSNVLKYLSATVNHETLISNLNQKIVPSGYAVGLDTCGPLNSQYCITGLSGKVDTQTYSMSKIGYANEVNWSRSDIASAFPGAASSLWELKIDNRTYDFELKTTLQLSYRFDQETATSDFAQSFSAALIPYRFVPLSDLPQYFESLAGNSYVNAVNVGGRACPNTAWHADSLCAIQSEFPENMRFNLGLHFQHGVGDWIDGRLTDPIISSNISSGAQNLSVEAAPIQTPQVSAVISADSHTAYAAGAPIGYYGENADNHFSLQKLEAARLLTSDRSTTTLSVWSFLTSYVNRLPAKCLKGSAGDLPVLGYSTSNALMYQFSAPNYADNSFSYNLAGMHYTSDGSIQRGVYNFGISSSLTTCIYSLKKVPVSATVSVTDSSGASPAVSTQVLSYDPKLAWLYLKVAGFHFSNPVIKVKL
jgi:hypothetical protein